MRGRRVAAGGKHCTLRSNGPLPTSQSFACVAVIDTWTLQEHAVKAVAEVGSCHTYDWDAGSAVPCTHWQYNRTVFTETIVSEVCS